MSQTLSTTIKYASSGLFLVVLILCTSAPECKKLEDIELLDCPGLGVNKTNQLTSLKWVKVLDLASDQMTCTNVTMQYNQYNCI